MLKCILWSLSKGEPYSCTYSLKHCKKWLQCSKILLVRMWYYFKVPCFFICLYAYRKFLSPPKSHSALLLLLPKLSVGSVLLLHLCSPRGPLVPHSFIPLLPELVTPCTPPPRHWEIPCAPSHWSQDFGSLAPHPCLPVCFWSLGSGGVAQGVQSPGSSRRAEAEDQENTYWHGLCSPHCIHMEVEKCSHSPRRKGCRAALAIPSTPPTLWGKGGTEAQGTAIPCFSPGWRACCHMQLQLFWSASGRGHNKDFLSLYCLKWNVF